MRHAVKSALSSRTRVRAPGRSNRDSLRIPVGLTTRVRGLGVVHNSGIGVFADAGIRISVGHVWLLFGVFQLACGTRRGRNPGTKKARRFRRA